MGGFYKVLIEGWSVTSMCDSEQAEAENLLLWVNDSIILELFVLDLGGSIGGGGGQQIPRVLSSQVLCYVASACVIASIIDTVTTSGWRSDKMAPIRSSPASCLPELTLVHVLAHKDANCMKPLYRLRGMNTFHQSSQCGVQPQPAFPPAALNVHPQDSQDSVLKSRLSYGSTF